MWGQLISPAAIIFDISKWRINFAQIMVSLFTDVSIQLVALAKLRFYFNGGSSKICVHRPSKFLWSLWTIHSWWSGAWWLKAGGLLEGKSKWCEIDHSEWMLGQNTEALDCPSLVTMETSTALGKGVVCSQMHNS
ncbi:hypothetical protein Gotur_002756 [Gossypium turneri]